MVVPTPIDVSICNKRYFWPDRIYAVEHTVTARGKKLTNFSRGRQTRGVLGRECADKLFGINIPNDDMVSAWAGGRDERTGRIEADATDILFHYGAFYRRPF